MKWIDGARVDMPKVGSGEMRFLSDAELGALLEVMSRSDGESFGCTCNTLRHRFCTRLGATPGVILRAAGHASLSTTMRTCTWCAATSTGRARSSAATLGRAGRPDEAGEIVQFPSSK
jgi:hypothetical protein